MARLGLLPQLIGALWALVRADALIPREAAAVLAPRVRLMGDILRVFSGPQARRGRPGERLAVTLEKLGPVAIKFGQLLSTRGDIFGADFALDLSRLKDNLAPFPIDVARAQAAASMGRPLETLFADFGPVVGSASLAQAHAATLLDGRAVAVKLLRPGVEAQVRRDIATMTLAAELSHAWIGEARRLEPKALVATVARALELELDLRFEAAGCDELGQIMAMDGSMTAPKIVWDGVSKRMLTLEWAEGMALSDPASLVQVGLDRPQLANTLIRAFLAQALDHGVFHADLHEGNLFVSAPAKVTAVDFGIVGRLGPGERRYLAEILWGFLQRDYARVAAIHFDAGYVPMGQDRAAFAQALRAVGEPIFGRTAQDVSMGRLLTQLFEITALFDMRLRPELVLLQKTMATVEGVARRIDPNHDIWAAADPIVRRWMARQLGPTAQVKSLVEDVRSVARNLATIAERAAAPPIVTMTLPPQTFGLGWFALGAVAASTAFALAAWLH